MRIFDAFFKVPSNYFKFPYLLLQFLGLILFLNFSAERYLKFVLHCEHFILCKIYLCSELFILLLKVKKKIVDFGGPRAILEELFRNRYLSLLLLVLCLAVTFLPLFFFVGVVILHGEGSFKVSLNRSATTCLIFSQSFVDIFETHFFHHFETYSIVFIVVFS